MDFTEQPRTHSIDPFTHWVIDDAFQPEVVRAAYAQWPSAEWPHWLRYGSGKLTTKDESRLPPACRELCHKMCNLPIEEITGISQTFPDFDLHGAGLHSIPADTNLGVHLDSDHHPLFGWRREFSVILFYNPEWKPEWGGPLELWDEDTTECVTKVEPRFNRLAIMQVSGKSFHGVPGLLKCPEDEMRKTLAVFYWSLSTTKSDRPRAVFV